jgi:hypothetical protein
MPLAMSRPWKHPSSAVFWLRKGVPEDLRKLVGKREEKRSLQTRDPAEAKRRHAEALAEIEARWANLRAGPKALTEREAHQMAMPIHDRWLQQHRDNPSQQTAWNVDLADQVFVKQKAPKSFDFLYDNTDMVVDRDRFQVLQMEKWCLELADERAMAQGFVIDDDGRRVLASAIAAALQRASLTLGQLAKGGHPVSTFFSTPNFISAPSELPRKPVSLGELVKGWAAERRPVAKTQYEWSRVVRQLETYLGHDNALLITGDTLIDWKRSMVDAGLRSKTIQDSKLAPVRAILQWGGSLKTSGSERIIPLHPALIETGFLKFAAKAKSGPLFAALSPDKFGKRGGNGTKVIPP